MQVIERAVTDLAVELGYQWASSLLAYVQEGVVLHMQAN